MSASARDELAMALSITLNEPYNLLQQQRADRILAALSAAGLKRMSEHDLALAHDTAFLNGMRASMEELVETFKDAALTDPRTSIKVGLLAVLDRLKPVVAKAYCAGCLEVDGVEPCDKGESYATRIIDKIKGA